MPEINVDGEDGELDKDSEEYKQRMIDKANGEDVDTSEPVGVESEEDNLLAGKYESEEDLNKGILETLKQQYDTEDAEEIYKNLEKDMHSQNQEEEEEEDEEQGDGEEGEDQKEEDDNDSNDQDNLEDSDDEELKDEFDNYDKYYNELVENGELSEESLEELEEQGYSRHIIDNYVKGVLADVQQAEQELYEVAGGEDEYNEMLDWAEDQLSQDEADAFNEALANDNLSQAKFAVEALYNRYKESGNRKPNLVKGKKPASTVDTYSSRQELMEDMNDPRYQKDPAYRQKVEQKLARSSIL